MFIRGGPLSAHSARPSKIPGWIVVVRENFSVNKRVCRKQTIEIVLRGFFSVFFFKFYIWLSRLSSKIVESNSFGFLNRRAKENLVVNNKDNGVFMSWNYQSESCRLEI